MQNLLRQAIFEHGVHQAAEVGVQALVSADELVRERQSCEKERAVSYFLCHVLTCTFECKEAPCPFAVVHAGSSVPAHLA